MEELQKIFVKPYTEIKLDNHLHNIIIAQVNSNTPHHNVSLLSSEDSKMA